MSFEALHAHEVSGYMVYVVVNARLAQFASWEGGGVSCFGEGCLQAGGDTLRGIAETPT